MAAKILFVFGSAITAQTFKSQGIINDILQNQIFNPSIIIRHGLKDFDSNFYQEPWGDIIPDFYIPNPSSDRKYFIWMWSAMICFRKRSRAFKQRAKRRILGKYRRGYFKNYLDFVIYLAKNLVRKDNVWLYLSYLPFVNILVCKFLSRFICNSEELESFVKNLKPDLIILVTNGAEAAIEEVRKSSEINETPWVMLIDNWDNISSKSIFVRNPSLLLVWGEQHKKLAIKIHKIDQSKIRIVGSARLQVYKEDFNSTEFKNIINRITYVGQQEPYDELEDIERILDVVNQGSSLVYRPHPLRTFSTSEIAKLVEIVQNSNLMLSLNNSRRSKTELDKIKQFKSETSSHAITNSDLILGPPTTMILEALLCHKLTFVITRDDKKHRTTSKIFWENYEHFDELKEVSFLKEIKDLSDFKVLLKEEIKNFSEILPKDTCILKNIVDLKVDNYVKKIEDEFTFLLKQHG
jgi:hypothetical protein